MAAAWLCQQENMITKFARMQEVADRLSHQNREKFNIELENYLKAIQCDRNTPWPEMEHGSSLWDSAPKADVWEVETQEMHDWVTAAFTRPGKPKTEAFCPENLSEHLVDLIAIMTKASRVGRGGFCWTGWNAFHWEGSGSGRKQSPSTGAHAVMVTAKCMRKLLPKWLKEPNGHMGAFFCTKVAEWQEELGACYVLPPIGGFFDHPSTTLGGRNIGKILESHWGTTWTQEGTRKESDRQSDRMLCKFTTRGHADKIQGSEVRLPQELEELMWLTRAPKGTAPSQCGERSYHRGETELTEKERGIERLNI